MSTYYPPGQQGGLWLQRQTCHIKKGLIPDPCLGMSARPHFPFSSQLHFVTVSYMVHFFTPITWEPQLVNKNSHHACLLDSFGKLRPRLEKDGKRSDLSSCNFCVPCHDFISLWDLEKQLSIGPGYGFPWVQFVKAQPSKDEKLHGVRYHHQSIYTLQPWSFGWSPAVGTHHAIVSLNKLHHMALGLLNSGVWLQF